MLVRRVLAGLEPDRVDLGRDRSAHRVEVEPAARLARHLRRRRTSTTSFPTAAVRDGQARPLLGWLDGAGEDGPTIVVGDFNADPAEPAYARMTRRRLPLCLRAKRTARSRRSRGRSGLQAPAMDDDGDPGCLDYIWVRGAIRVVSARLAFDRPAVDDPGLYPSDHLGVAARVEIG